MKDSWCAPVITKSGAIVSGGAARNVRIAECGGMDEIVESVATRAAKDALRIANQVVTENRRQAVRRVK